MHLGFLTACLPKVTLDELVPWAAKQGFRSLELAAWPYDAERDYLAHHVRAESFKAEDAERITDLFAEAEMNISSLGYYDNNLHPDRTRREEHLAHLRKVIEAARLLGVDRVGTFVGARPDRSPAENMAEIGSVFRELVQFAEDRGVRLMIENCPMENWVKFGLPGNYAYSPELWDALFEEVPSENFGLNLDPSHLHWLGIDPCRAARDYAGRIFHVHAKDTEMMPEGRYRYGVLAEQLGDNPWRSGWWRYRMPGKGDVDWKAFITTLHEIGYDDVMSIEHEDHEYEGTEARIKEGLELGFDYLSALLKTS